MPNVTERFRGDNKNPRLRLLKSDREILANASGLLRSISNLTTGFHAELAKNAAELSTAVARLSEIEEMDLTNPW